MEPMDALISMNAQLAVDLAIVLLHVLISQELSPAPIAPLDITEVDIKIKEDAIGIALRHVPMEEDVLHPILAIALELATLEMTVQVI